MRFFLVLILIIIFVEPASSDPRDWRDCESSAPDRMIKGCTRIIRSGKESRKNLSLSYMNRGNAYHLKNQYDQAIANYDEAIKVNPRNARAYYNRGLSYIALKDNEHALEALNGAVNTLGGHPGRSRPSPRVG